MYRVDFFFLTKKRCGSMREKNTATSTIILALQSISALPQAQHLQLLCKWLTTYDLELWFFSKKGVGDRRGWEKFFLTSWDRNHMGVEPKIGVGPPNHPILIGFSSINHPFWGGKHPYKYFWKHPNESRKKKQRTSMSSCVKIPSPPRFLGSTEK